MKLLLDKCVPSITYQEILKKGHDVDWVRHWPQDPGDREILRVAREAGRILITLDKDFGELAVSAGMAHCGIVLLRKLRIRHQAPRCLEALEQYGQQLQREAIVTVEPGRLRCRLPSNP
jgi:predicted nuclease of predicted toxin-antitoxin system